MEGRAEQTPITGDPLPWCPPQRNLFPVACEWASDLQEHKRQVHSVSKSVEKTTEPSTPSRAYHLSSFLPSQRKTSKREEASASLRKKFLLRKPAGCLLRGASLSTAQSPQPSLSSQELSHVHLHHSLPQMFLREERGFQTVD